MRLPPVIQKREVRRMALLLIVLLAIAAIINVPWAVTMIRSRLEKPRLPNTRTLTTLRQPVDQVPREWPSRTPHPKPWPPPNHWQEGGAFGCSVINARYVPADPNDAFVMDVQWVGWPLPVIELKHAWWPDNAVLGGNPEPDPRPSVMLGGLLLNPLILGGGAWLALTLPWLIFTVIRRTSRWRNRRCMACGYPMRGSTSAVCTECGGPLVR